MREKRRKDKKERKFLSLDTIEIVVSIVLIANISYFN